MAIKKLTIDDLLKASNLIYSRFGSWEKGEYKEYVPFERDSNGTFYGYKVLFEVMGREWLKSPFMKTEWENYELTSDSIPSEFDFISGIHGTKSLASLQPWIETYSSYVQHLPYPCRLVVVRLALYGEVIIETEEGFRAHMAQIIEMIR